LSQSLIHLPVKYYPIGYWSTLRVLP